MALPLVSAPTVRVYAGDTTPFGSFTFTLQDEPRDLTGWSFRSQWRRSPRAETALTLDVDTSGAAEGILAVSASATVTAQMGGPGVWDLEGTFVYEDERAVEVHTFVVGKTAWQADVTRE
jgi:hypothetical protein